MTSDCSLVNTRKQTVLTPTEKKNISQQRTEYSLKI
jgi:hypothetical protein